MQPDKVNTYGHRGTSGPSNNNDEYMLRPLLRKNQQDSGLNSPQQASIGLGRSQPGNRRQLAEIGASQVS